MTFGNADSRILLNFLFAFYKKQIIKKAYIISYYVIQTLEIVKSAKIDNLIHIIGIKRGI